MTVQVDRNGDGRAEGGVTVIAKVVAAGDLILWAAKSGIGAG